MTIEKKQEPIILWVVVTPGDKLPPAETIGKRSCYWDKSHVGTIPLGCRLCKVTLVPSKIEWEDNRS